MLMLQAFLRFPWAAPWPLDRNLCGHAATSAQMASSKGPFAGFAKNRELMLRVAHAPGAAYAINRDECPEALARVGGGSGQCGAAG
jgi:hypothetical protein